jgi:flagellar basal-body rod protein FlgG
MNGAFYIGVTGLGSQQRALDVIANNIANMNTPSFKRSEVRFSELVRGGGAGGAAAGGDASAPMSGVTADANGRVFAQGDLRQTGKPLDLAISGDGFIELLGPGGQTMLWRGGTLSVNPDGYLSTADGTPLKAMISVPQGMTQIAIGRDGKVLGIADGDAGPAEIGQIDLVMARDPAGLAALDGGMFQAANEADLMIVAPGEEGSGALVQGSIENSNVQMSDEMVTMLLMQRAYAANAQVVQAGDQLMAIANQLKR